VNASRFPDPRDAPGDQPLAYGGDLHPETLLDAYMHGIFPWPDADGALWWWSPDPRCVIPLDGFHVSRSLHRTVRSGRFTDTVDHAFTSVVRGCADRPEGTWIVPAYARAFQRMHELGHAHSVEVWDADGRLVGGVYGLALGGAFMAESMFHRATDASKVALWHLVQRLRAGGFELLDAQMPTPHLESLGAVTIGRDAYLDRLSAALRTDARLGRTFAE
jgi:leucyl/phenylalanyl-tRNA--protein transferase